MIERRVLTIELEVAHLKEYLVSQLNAITGTTESKFQVLQQQITVLVTKLEQLEGSLKTIQAGFKKQETSAARSHVWLQNIQNWTGSVSAWMKQIQAWGPTLSEKQEQLINWSFALQDRLEQIQATLQTTQEQLNRFEQATQERFATLEAGQQDLQVGQTKMQEEIEFLKGDMGDLHEGTQTIIGLLAKSSIFEQSTQERLTALEAGQQDLRAGQQATQEHLNCFEQSTQERLMALEAGQQDLRAGQQDLRAGQQATQEHLNRFEQSTQERLMALEAGQQVLQAGQQALRADVDFLKGDMASLHEGIQTIIGLLAKPEAK